MYIQAIEKQQGLSLLREILHNQHLHKTIKCTYWVSWRGYFGKAAFPSYSPPFDKDKCSCNKTKIIHFCFCDLMDPFCFLLNNPFLQRFFRKKNKTKKSNTQFQISDFKFGFRSVICYRTLDPTDALLGIKDIICMLVWNPFVHGCKSITNKGLSRFLGICVFPFI